MADAVDTRAGLSEALDLLDAGADLDGVRARIRAALADGVEPERPLVTCDTCKGSGKYALLTDGDEDCFKCKGTGRTMPFWPRIVRSWRWDAPGGPIAPSFRGNGYVSVRPCDPEHGGRTYLGILVGEVAFGASATVDGEGRLKVGPGMRNPAMYVFALGKVVYGMESWWGAIRGPDDMRNISDEDVDSVWYVQALRAMQAKESIHPADELAALRASAEPDAERVDALEERLAGDREGRVGRTHHAVVSVGPDRDVVDVMPLPDLESTLNLLSACEVSVVDTETTGLHPLLGDRMVSAHVLEGCLSDDGSAFLVTREPFSEVVNPGRPSSPQARAVHGYTDEELAGKPAFAEVAQALGLVLEGRIVVAHNAPFDVGFLDMEFARTPFEGPSALATDVVDTRVVCKMLWPEESGSLDALATRLGVDRGARDERHTASEDTRLLARCLPGLVAAIRARLAADRP